MDKVDKRGALRERGGGGRRGEGGGWVLDELQSIPQMIRFKGILDGRIKG